MLFGKAPPYASQNAGRDAINAFFFRRNRTGKVESDLCLRMPWKPWHSLVKHWMPTDSSVAMGPPSSSGAALTSSPGGQCSPLLSLSRPKRLLRLPERRKILLLSAKLLSVCLSSRCRTALRPAVRCFCAALACSAAACWEAQRPLVGAPSGALRRRLRGRGKYQNGRRDGCDLRDESRVVGALPDDESG